MQFNSSFRDTPLAEGILKRIHRNAGIPARFMEFCGGHTVAICKFGIRQALPSTIEMVSGPGCPVCITPDADIDKAIALAQVPGVIITTFGDMLRVPGSRSSLQQVKAAGADVRMVYSTLDALKIATDNPHNSVVFLGIGFETTAPTVAASILKAEEKHISNYCVLSLHKLCPPVIRALLDSGEIRLNGLICPGHVSTVIGSQPWKFIARDYGIPCVVTGFELLDILQSISMLVTQVASQQAMVEIAYRRGVKPEGNREALRLMERIFEPCNAEWRGMGEIPGSGLKIRDNYRRFDAESRFDIKVEPSQERKGCICGEILRGVKAPVDCPLFGKECTPEKPVGPCMVSSEGSCAAHFLYRGVAIDG